MDNYKERQKKFGSICADDVKLDIAEDKDNTDKRVDILNTYINESNLGDIEHVMGGVEDCRHVVFLDHLDYGDGEVHAQSVVEHEPQQHHNVQDLDAC